MPSPVGHSMMWWPFSSDYTMAPRHIFPRPLKADWGEVFDWHNAHVMAIAFLITAPLVMLALLWKGRKSQRIRF